MLDPNIENTQPSKPAVDPEKTQVTRVKSTNPEVENTQPVLTQSNNHPPAQPEMPTVTALAEMDLAAAVEADNPPPAKTARIRRWPWIIGGIVVILLLGALGGFLGYRAAVQLRSQVSAEQIAAVATEQFMLGLQEQAEGKYDLALQRFEYVIQLDPGFPGAQEKMAEVMMAIALAQTPTATIPVSTPTLTPTPDMRAEEEIFNNARQLLANKEWFAAIQVLDTLRNKNLTYRTVEVDGMYYVALRFRGLAKINAGALEEGLYDLALVERFAAPLDVDAEGLRTWARLYLTGAAYWGARWDRVIFYFAQIYPYYPSMRDASGLTALERYRVALMKYGDQLAGEGKYCEASEQYRLSYEIGADPVLDPTATAIYLICNPPQPTGTTTPTSTITPTLDSSTPSPTTPVDTPTETPSPTETPTP